MGKGAGAARRRVRRRDGALIVLRAAAIAFVVTMSVAPAGIAGAAERAGDARTIVSLEFDHAFTDQLPAVQTANSYGMKVTLFAMSGRLGMTGYMTAAQLLALQSQGNEVGGHTINHPDLAKLSPAAQRYEICDDRAALEVDGFDVTDFAYPYGYLNRYTPGIVRGCGYGSARIAGGLGAHGGCPNPCPPAETIPPRNPFQTRTVNSVMKTTSLAMIENYVTTAERSGGGWVQIVFHYVCDGCDPYSVSASTLDRFLAWLAAPGALRHDRRDGPPGDQHSVRAGAGERAGRRAASHPPARGRDLPGDAGHGAVHDGLAGAGGGSSAARRDSDRHDCVAGGAGNARIAPVASARRHGEALEADDPAQERPAHGHLSARHRDLPAMSERERVSQVYEGYAASDGKQRDWSAENPGNVAIRAELTDAVFELAGPTLLSAGKILDVGCGTGWWLERLAEDPRVSAGLEGLELLPERQQAAAGRVPVATVTLGDARRLPYGNRRFDVVTMFTVLSSLASVSDALAAFGEALRVVGPVGRPAGVGTALPESAQPPYLDDQRGDAPGGGREPRDHDPPDNGAAAAGPAPGSPNRSPVSAVGPSAAATQPPAGLHLDAVRRIRRPR